MLLLIESLIGIALFTLFVVPPALLQVWLYNC